MNSESIWLLLYNIKYLLTSDNRAGKQPAGASEWDQTRSVARTLAFRLQLDFIATVSVVMEQPKLPLGLTETSENLIIRFMKKTRISVTEAARNFADCINRAHYQNVTFVLLRNGEPVARLVPGDEKVCVGRDLAEVLAETELPENEAKAWHRDLQAARKSLKAPADKWQ